MRAGEVLGFAGLVGAGRTEAFEAIIGLRRRSAGRIEIAGRRVDLKNPRDAMRHGLTYLSEDRKGKGLHVNLSLQDNLTLMTLEHYAHPLLDLKAGREALTKAVRDFASVPATSRAARGCSRAAISKSSRLAKFLQPNPDVIVLDEPTRGVDIGAKRDIYFLIHRLASEGLIRTARADRLVPSRRGAARGQAAGDARPRPSDRRGVDCPCDRHPLKPRRPAARCASRIACTDSARSRA